MNEAKIFSKEFWVCVQSKEGFSYSNLEQCAEQCHPAHILYHLILFIKFYVI